MQGVTNICLVAFAVRATLTIQMKYNARGIAKKYKNVYGFLYAKSVVT
jgi:hypothetical protein